MEINDITGAVVDSAIRLHRGLGPGLLESVYETILARDLIGRGLHVQRQFRAAFEYDGMQFDEGFCVDLLVEGLVIVELKSVIELAPIHKKQVLTYLRLLNLEVGLLINFGAPVLKDGLHRIANNYRTSASPRLCVSQDSPHLRVNSPVSEEPHV